MRHPISRRTLEWTMLLGGFLFVALMLWKMHGSMQELERARGNFKQEQQQFHPKDEESKISHDAGDNIPQRLAGRKGLSVRNGEFYLDEKPFQILGGSLHYFRFPQEYWYDRLYALKACGLNTVTTYIPWNAHEPEIGRFIFSGMLDLQQFIKTAHSMGLYVILRVGPYICAEWEWGGLPSWLLRHKQLRVRTNDSLYLGYVAEYFDKLLSMIVPHQYIYGGPVIAVQVENEYATYSHDPQHVIQIGRMIKDRWDKLWIYEWWRYDRGSIVFKDYLTLFELMTAFKSWMVQSELPITFEDFPSVSDRRAGQAYGYIVYECDLDIQKETGLDLHGNVRDRALVFINQVYQDTVSASTTNYNLKVHPGPEVAVTFLVENQGRINWVPYGEADDFANQRKGFVGNISLAGKAVTKWRMWPFDFQEQFLSKLTQYTSDGSLKWKIRDPSLSFTSPVLLRATMTIDEVKPKDTFLELEGFNKGFVIINQHNLGRYWNTAGPQRRLYLPGVWLKQGVNEILVFEEYAVGSVISFHTTSGIST